MMARRMWKLYQRFLVSDPWKTQTISTGVLVATGDVITQQFVERKGLTEHDVPRTLRMGAVGLVIGPILRTWYLTIERLVVTSSRPKVDALKKMLVDQSLFAPCMVAFFFFISDTLSGKTLQQAKTTIQERYYETMISNYKLWPAAQIINFTFIPLPHRVAYAQVIAIFWNTYLSWMANKPCDMDMKLEQEQH